MLGHFDLCLTVCVAYPHNSLRRPRRRPFRSRRVRSTDLEPSRESVSLTKWCAIFAVRGYYERRLAMSVGTHSDGSSRITQVVLRSVLF